ncbi:MAG: hypothetical protein GXP61_10520 [Epsilonproteobacteria bacterium]|nr:hypothetical protein [Campylobacterota bacterium]
MNQGGWSCPHDTEGACDIIKKECDPGDRGCVLYRKVKFSDVNLPSNEAFEQRMKRKMKKLQEELCRDK